jgi:hypothetical protein
MMLFKQVDEIIIVTLFTLGYSLSDSLAWWDLMLDNAIIYLYVFSQLF